MKGVFLIGDSARIGAAGSPGYGVYASELLSGVAEVYAPKSNCCFAQFTQRYLHEWAAGVPCEDVAVVHWNNGLWDILRIRGDEPFTEIGFYGETLVRLHGRIRATFPRAKIVFALTTYVREELLRGDLGFYNSDTVRYNQKAIEVLSPLGVEFNDLYSISAGFAPGMYVDCVHFGEDGSRILGEAVARCIRALL